MDENTPDRVVDVVLDAPASVSIYLQALLARGREREAAAVREAHDAACRVAATELERIAVWSTRTEPAMAAPYSYAPTSTGIEIVLHSPPDHHALHGHVVTADRVDLATIRRTLPRVTSCYERSYADVLAERLGVHLVATSHGLQLEGVAEDLVTRFDPPPCRTRPAATQLRTPTAHGAYEREHCDRGRAAGARVPRRPSW